MLSSQKPRPAGLMAWKVRLRGLQHCLIDARLRRKAAETNVELRQLLYGKKPHVYRIIYEVDEARRTVLLIAIRHGARPTLFSKES